MAASSSYPTRSSDRARNAATQISTTLRTSPETNGGSTEEKESHPAKSKEKDGYI
jgi:hypothetical protein